MLQNVIVIIIVGLALLFTLRRIYRIVSSKRAACSCATEQDCPGCSVPGEGSESRGAG